MLILNSNLNRNLLKDLFLSLFLHFFFFSEISFFGLTYPFLEGGSKAQRLKKIYRPRAIFNIPGPPCERRTVSLFVEIEKGHDGATLLTITSHLTSELTPPKRRSIMIIPLNGLYQYVMPYPYVQILKLDCSTAPRPRRPIQEDEWVG